MRAFAQPEAELLVRLVRPAFTDADAARAAELLRAGVDFDELLRLSLAHGLMPRVHQRLNTHFADLVPPAPLARFREHFQSNAARNLYLTGELLRILDEFEAGGVSAIPYKGPALAALLDGGVTTQQFADLDIIVRPTDYARAADILAARGYAPHFELKGSEEEEAFKRLSYVQLFERGGGTGVVELHWQVAPRFFARPLLTEEFWGRLRSVTLNGRDVLAPSREDLILLLAVHGTKDVWERFKWVAGLATLLAKDAGEIDWPLLLTRASAAGLRRTLLLGLFLAHDALGAPLPPEVLGEAEGDREVRRLAAWVLATVFDAPPGLTRRTLFHLRARERTGDRLRYCALFALTTTPVDWAALRLPRRLAFLYYFVRPFRLLGKYVLKTPGRAH